MRKAALFPLALPLVLALSACGSTPEEDFAKARAEFAAHDYAAARVHLASVLSAKPGNPEALLLQARTLLALDDGDGAGTALDSLAAKAPATPDLAELRAEAALLRQVPDVALDLLKDSTSAEASRLRGLAAIQQGKLPEALEHFEKGLAAGGNARLFADMGRVHLMQGDMPGALAMVAKAAAAAPDGIDTLLLAGQVAVRQGDLGTALDHYSRAEKLYPTSLAALTGKAAVLGDLGRSKELGQALDRAEALAPRNPAVVFLKARAAADRKDWAAVRTVIQPVEASLAATDPLRVIYGEALLRLGQGELALAQLQPIVRAMPAQREAVSLLAEAQLARGDAAGAVSTLRALADSPAARSEDLALMIKAARAAGDPAAATYEARSRQPQAQALGQDIADADAAMRAGNWAGAVQAYRRITASTDGRNVMVLNNFAYAQSMLGNHAEAIELADKALKLAPGNASVLDTAGFARLRAGKDLTAAKSLLRQAAQQAPQNSAIRAHLAEAERAAR